MTMRHFHRAPPHPGGRKRPMGYRAMVSAALAALLVLGGIGCGGAGKPVPVAGTVTVDGRPVGGAVVQFFPQGENGRPAAGQTNEGGSFRLTTFTADDGALPGDYVVTLAWEQELPASFYEGMAQKSRDERYRLIVEAKA